MFGVGTFTRVARELRQDLTAAQDRDPAARGIGRAEILLTYGGVQALLAHRVRVEGKRPGGPDADWAHLPDPVADAIRALAARVAELEKLLAETTGRKPEPTADVRPLRNVRGSDPAGG